MTAVVTINTMLMRLFVKYVADRCPLLCSICLNIGIYAVDIPEIIRLNNTDVIVMEIIYASLVEVAP